MITRPLTRALTKSVAWPVNARRFGAEDIVFDPLSVSTGKLYFNASYAGNTYDRVQEDFLPAAVNTATNKITLSASGFTRVNNREHGRCYFTTTGTLPGGLSLGVEYIPINNADGTFSFYKVASDSDYADFAGYENGETILPGQYYMFEKAVIDITDQGTGTHTIWTYPLVNKLQNILNATDLFTQSTRSAMFDVRSDEKGSYINLPGATALSTDYLEPEGKLLTDNLSASGLGDLFAGKRYLYSVSVVRPKVDPWLSKARAICKPANVNSGTGVFTAVTHGIETGEEVTADVLSAGGAFPTPTISFAANIYARAVSANTLTIHPTALDATNNTNAYVYSNTGTGIFAVTGKRSVRSFSGRRKALFDLNMQSNDHSFTPTAYNTLSVMPLNSAGYFLSGSFDGWVALAMTAANSGNTAQTIKRCKIFVPSGAVAPTCRDTGLPFTTGTYYLTLQPTDNTYCRIHRTLANAQASVGITTSSLSNTVVLKFSALGSGEAAFMFPDDYINYRNFDDSFSSTGITNLANADEFGVYVSMVDYNDGSGKHRLYSGANQVKNLIDNQIGSKNSPLPAQSANTTLLLGNAAQPHISGKYDVYEVFIGASDTDPTTDMQYLINGFMEEYSI